MSYARSNNGYGQIRSFDLCSDGSFFYRFEELQSSQFGNAAGERTDSGVWTLNGNSLQLQFRRQGSKQYSVQQVATDVVSLDGTKYKVERSGRCR